MAWTIERTDTFLNALQTHKKNRELLNALEKKLVRLQNEPHSIGGMLCGELHNWQSTRLIRKFRLLFKLDEKQQKVILGAIDHRKDAY